MINIVIFNGGRGAGTIIPALQSIGNVNITSIVNAYDDGKSTGEIRKFFNMLGPSDIRKVQQLMLPKDDPDYHANNWIFNHRFAENKTSKKIKKDLLAEINSRKKTFFDNHFIDQGKLNAIKNFLKILLRI